jgi:hypothetical protein
LEDEQNQVEEANCGPGILRSGFERALKDLRNGKAPGKDKISREVIKALAEKAQDDLYGIIQDCYESRKQSENFKRSSMVTILKRVGAKKFEEHQTLSLVSHTAKVLTWRVGRRIAGYVYISFVDLEKAFNNIEWNKMFSTMKKLGIDHSNR